jgi:serine/threonine protein kinase/ABC-type branched-subunit amino acid transport system substrate-binding protein
MECPYCSAANRDGTRYCSSCGKFIGSAPASGAASTGGSSPVASGTNPSNPTNPTGQSGSYRSLAAGSRLQGGRYVIKSVLGQGGMGAALLATDLRLDSKSVVLKELISDSVDPAKQQEDVRNFKREVSMLAHIDHPLVPSVTDHFQEGTRYFMVQEHIDGENLEARLERTNQPMKEREALICASEILDVLDYLAQQTPPIVHRDIKPANVIIGARDKKAHLVDFGIARAEVARNVRRKQTSALGTPGYAPPEQYQGNADPRSDIYGLAATLHHLLTNRDPRNHPPFNFPPLRALNPQISAETEHVIQRALLNDNNQRYQSASAMKQEVDMILHQRFGLSGSIDSYTLGAAGGTGASGTMISGAALSAVDQTLVAPPTTVTPVQPLTQSAPPPPPGQSYPNIYASSGPIPPPPNTPSYPGFGYPNSPSSPGFPGTGPGLNLTPGYLSTPPASQKKPRGRAGLYVVLVLLLLLVLVGAGAFAMLRFFNPASSTIAKTGIGVVKVGGESIGISDGTVAFDTTRENGSLKNQAAQQLQNVLTSKSEDYDSVISRLNEALKINTNDAEALIYKENLQVLKSGAPYVTFVVATMLTGSNAGWVGTGRDNLQGAYTAQKEFNDGSKLNNGVRIRLLIANSGSNDTNVKTVAEQIIELSKNDKTFAGVLGWPHSAQAKAEYPILAGARIPMVSPSASDDALSGISPYFFRVAPPNRQQAIQGARYAKQQLHANKVVVFYDKQNPYTNSLADGFMEEFKNGGGQVVGEENYTVGKTGTLPSLLQDALGKNPNLIYFAGYSSDVSVLLSNPLPQGLPVLGGDALYQLGGYSQSSRTGGFEHLSFTAFAYPDEWEALGYTRQKPTFFSEYRLYFDPEGKNTGGYGYGRPANDAILSYDAMLALLNGANQALTGNKQQITPIELRDGLSKLTGPHAFQGVSGQVSFDSRGDPIDKTVVMLHVDALGHIQIDSHVLGKFLLGS